MATPKLDKLDPAKGIRSVYDPGADEKKMLKHVYDRYTQMRDARNGSAGGYYNIEGDWDKWEKQWNAYRPPKDVDDWKSNIFIPLTTSVIEAQLSEVIELIPMPWVVERGADDAPKAAVINAILGYTWDQAKSNVAMFEMIKDAFIFGTGIGQEYYWREPRTIKDENGKTQDILEYDDCYLEPVRLYDFFIDEKARAFSGPYAAQDCIRRYIMDYDAFRNFFKGEIWDPDDRAKLVQPGGDTNYYEFYIPPDRIEKDREVEVLWYWNKPDDLLCIVANDVRILGKPNPYKHKQLPFVRVIDVRRPYQFYGKGECELLESLQDETNTLRRMTIDRSHLDIDKPILVSDTFQLEDEDAIARPHGLIPVGDVNGARPLEYGDIPASVFQQLKMLNDDKVRVTGMDEIQQSVAGAGTATEASILKEATIRRLNMKMWQMKQDTMIDIGRLRVENIMQFYSQPKLTQIVGEKMLAKAKAAGTVVSQDGKNFQAGYRQVRLKNQQFGINQTTQQPQITPAQGYTFFEAKPEFFLPSHGGFDIHYKATEDVPISKPLQQKKADEMYDRLIKNPAVDPWKLAEFELKSRDLDPDEFKKAQGPQQQPGVAQGPNLQKIIDLAGVENSQMMQGKKIGPTPFAPVVHTQVHLTFMQSEQFKKDASHEVLQNFTNHVMGEITAQHFRQQGQPGDQQPQGNAPVGQQDAPGQQSGGQGADIGATMQDVNPGQSMGATDVSGDPGGMPSGLGTQ